MINYDVALQEFEIFLLVMVRISTFVYTAPFFNTANAPNKVKIGFCLALSILTFSLVGETDYTYTGVIDYAIIVAQEAAIGLLLGAVSYACVEIIFFTGHIIDVDMGISMASVLDPTSNTQVGIMGNLYYYILNLLLIVSGLYRYLIGAIVDTYEVIPIGKAQFHESLFDTIVGFMGDYFTIGFRIALPMFACMLLLNCILGILARIAPQMNMFVMGMQLKIFAGLAVIFATIILLPSVSTFVFQQIRTMMVKLVGGMTPM